MAPILSTHDVKAAIAAALFGIILDELEYVAIRSLTKWCIQIYSCLMYVIYGYF